MKSEKTSFTKHLEKCSKIVASWPEWKRNILGGNTMGKEIPFKTEINGKEIGFVEIVPNGDYHKFLKDREGIKENDCCAITGKPLDADNGFYMCIWTRSSMPNCFADKKEVEKIGFQTAVETIVDNWNKAKSLRHWFK